MADPSIERFRRVVATACAQLEERRQEVNDLNVFPVADGDTGDNMTQTLRAVMEELNRLNGQVVDDVGRDEIVQAVATAALLGARGNSGVILSQIVRGAAEELTSRPGELVDPVLVSSALARAADAAYASVRNPAEGTMITVIREMAHRVATELAHMEKKRLEPGASDSEQDALLADVLEKALEAAEASVERGPDLLPVLREHGVVDAGGYGMTVIIAGLIAGLRGQQAAAPVVAHHHVVPLHEGEHESSLYRYCTNFVVAGKGLEEGRAYVPGLEEIGDSILVVGDAETIRVHVHTDEPERAVALFENEGTVQRLDVADMHEQEQQRTARLRASEGNGASVAASEVEIACGVVAVAAGAGMRNLYERLGAHVVEGGATLNPSTFEILAGIHSVPAEQVIVLPNSRNVVMAADRAAELSEKTVEVVESHHQQAGLAILVEHDSNVDAARNADRLRSVLAGVRIGAVAPAARDDRKGRFRSGEAVGFLDEQIVAWGDVERTLRTVLEQLGQSCELVTWFAGQGAPLDRDAVDALAPEGLELEGHAGDQPHYWWLLAAE
ncbi:MAG: DAK2 domain-containing protein [Solirubrobacterales bacterium]